MTPQQKEMVRAIGRKATAARRALAANVEDHKALAGALDALHEIENEAAQVLAAMLPAVTS